jgi:predicted AAA+ superfamily ATPase
MYRFALDYLNEWKNRISRKPLVIRGARQVGKSYLVRVFAEREFENLIEINFERDNKVAALFEEESPLRIVKLLELQFGKQVVPGKTIIFLDEIQAAPKVFAKLRYFYEDIPGLHIVTAGSLLEFVLSQHEFSMPVGRIEYLHLGPMTFEEFLLAGENKNLQAYLRNYSFKEKLPDPIHQKLMSLYKTFISLGGMPQVLSTFMGTSSFKEAEIIKESIMQTFKDDFSKYGRKINHQRLLNVFTRLPETVGRKFKYVNIDRDEQAKEIQKSLNLLELAKIAYPVRHSACNGIPIGAETDERTFKILFLDVGLMLNSCGLSLLDLKKADDVMLVNSGALAEQAVGQHLLYSQDYYKEPELYYWVREKKNSEAELDYVISEGNRIIPIEVKSGKTGRLKSLHQFIYAKRSGLAVRFNAETPSFTKNTDLLSDGNSVEYNLLSLPLYMAEELRRIIRTIPQK